MTNYRVNWTLRDQKKIGSLISAIGIAVSYRDQEYYISITLPQPTTAKTPENKDVALAEIRQLRNALNDILDER